MTNEDTNVECACGCGEKLDFSKGRKTKRFIHGHRIRIRNEELRQQQKQLFLEIVKQKDFKCFRKQ